MLKNQTLPAKQMAELDSYYREGGLRQMASPHVHYHEPACPHPGCLQRMEWIDFQKDLFGDAEGIYKPLVRSWWEGKGFVGRCPGCGGWIRFTTLGMEVINDDQAEKSAKLPENWHGVAQFG
jgi:hypothetical protein